MVHGMVQAYPLRDVKDDRAKPAVALVLKLETAKRGCAGGHCQSMPWPCSRSSKHASEATSVHVQEDQATRRDEHLDPSDDAADQAEGTAG